MLYALVEFEVERTVHVVGRHLVLGDRALTQRHEQVRMLVVGQHDRDRALDVRQPGVEQSPTGAGGVHHVAVAEKDERVDTLLPHRIAQPGTAFAVHPRHVREVGNLDGGTVHRRERGHSTPRKFLMLLLTIFVAASGPTASTTVFRDFSEYPNVDSLCG